MASNSWSLFGLDFTSLQAGLLSLLNNPVNFFKNRNYANENHSASPSQGGSSSDSEDGLNSPRNSDSVSFTDPVQRPPNPKRPTCVPLLNLSRITTQTGVPWNGIGESDVNQYSSSRSSGVSSATGPVILNPDSIPFENTDANPRNQTKPSQKIPAPPLNPELSDPPPVPLQQSPYQGDFVSRVPLRLNPIQISTAPSTIFNKDASSVAVSNQFKMSVLMPSLTESIKSNQELPKEHLKELFNKFDQSQESEFKPYYGGATSKDMFLNVAVEKIQSALRSPANGDRVKGVLGSLYLGYEGKAVNELKCLSEATKKALISKTSQNELSDADKNKIKEQLESSFELYEKLENVGVYLLREKPTALASAPNTKIQTNSRITNSRTFKKVSENLNPNPNQIISM